MKRKLLILSSAVAIALPTAIVFAAIRQEKEANAYEAVKYTALNRDIDLNDTDESVIRSYYSAANGFRGDSLLIKLKQILSNGQIYYSYDGGSDYKNAIWNMYEISDRDWEKSPASEISGYNSSTNTISNYTYYTNASTTYIHALYVNRDVDNPMTAKEHNALATGINQEHVWQKSAGFEDSGRGGARGDPMHLMAGNARVNQQEHNNNFYGYVDKTQPYTTPTDVNPTSYAHLKNNYSGVSKTFGAATSAISGESVIVFEPQDCDKGDIARALFYMAARYNHKGDSDTIDANEPDLELIDDLTNWRKSGYQSSDSGETGKIGLITDLLEWNRIDPPDEYETHRNNLLYTNFTNNRNPFIDFPEWAEIIWGNKSGTAKPATDPIGGVEGITVSKTDIKLDIPNTTTVNAKTSNGTSVNWVIDDPTIISISSSSSASGANITITPLKTGATTLTASATIDETNYEVPISIAVVAPLTSIAVSGQTTSYVRGSTFSFDGVCTASYSDGSIKTVTPTSVSSVNTSTIGSKTVTVTYTEDEVTKSTSYTINIVKPDLSSIEVKNPKTSYGKGSTFVKPQVIAKYVNGDEEDVSSSTNLTFTGFDSTTAGSNTINVSYVEGGITKTASYTVTIEEDPVLLTSISVSGGKTEYEYGEEFTVEGIEVTATYSNSDIANVTSEATFTGYNATTAGVQTITVSYVEGEITKTTTFEVTVKPKIVPESLSITGGKREYEYGEEFTVEGISAVATYTNGTTADVTNKVTYNGYSPTTAGVQTITATYVEDDVTVTTTFEVTVKAQVVLESITLSGGKREYVLGEPFNSDGLVVTAHYSDGTTQVVEPENINIPDMTTTGEKTVLVGYKEGDITVTATYTITISDNIPVLSSITISNPKTKYTVGDHFVKPTVIARYSDDSIKDVSSSENLVFSGQKMSEAGKYTVTAQYTENGVSAVATYEITVEPAKSGITFDTTTIIIIAAGGGTLIVGVTLAIIFSKSFRKKAGKAVTKGVKKAVKKTAKKAAKK